MYYFICTDVVMYLMPLCVTLISFVISVVISATVGRFLGRSGALLVFLLSIISGMNMFCMPVYLCEDEDNSALGYNILHTMLYVCDIAIDTNKLTPIRAEAMLQLKHDLIIAYGGRLNVTDADYFTFRDV